MRIDEHFRPGQPAAVDQAGMVLGIAEDRVSPADQGRNRAGIRRIAGRKNQRGFHAQQFGQPPFELGVRRRVAANQRTCTAPQPSRWQAPSAAAINRGSAASAR